MAYEGGTARLSTSTSTMLPAEIQKNKKKKKNKKKNKKRNNLDARELVKKCKQVTLTILLSDLTSFDIKENLYLD